MARGLPGLKGLSLGDFCDVVWADIVDSCPAMGNPMKWQKSMYHVFILGTEPPEDEDAEPSKPGSGFRPIPKDALARSRELYERAKARASQVETPSDE